MNQFVILFRQGPYLFTDAGRARRQDATIAWARELNARGHRLEPRTFAPSLTRADIEVSDDACGRWPVSALLFVTARDLAEAAVIANSHPANQYNTAVEVSTWPAAAALSDARAA